MDNLSREKRAKIMASIHSKDTRPELSLREALSERGLKFETYYCAEKIDIAFPEQKIAIFVDGCFWHSCPLHSHKITTNESYWYQKLEKNRERDRLKTERLRALGWTVMRFWEHDMTDIKKVVNAVEEELKRIRFC